jgi:hypothetical protein
VRDAGFGQCAPVCAKSVRRQHLRACGRVIGVNPRDDVRRAVKRDGRPQRQRGVDAAARQLGAERAI